MMLNTSSFFKKSPLNEVVCSIQYKSSDFSFIIEDEFYQSVKNVYPKVIDNSPLSPIFDKKSVEFFPDIQTEINRIPLIRHFFINELENKLIQFQDGRFIFNWRKIPEKEIQYPRFQTVFSEFKYYWEILVSIFEKKNINTEINQLELCYSNHIHLEDFAIENKDLSPIFKNFILPKTDKEFEGLNILLSFFYEDILGHLNISIRSGVRNYDKKEIILFEMTVRGIQSVTLQWDQWFEKAHSIIISTFLEIISNKAKEQWGYQ